MINEVKCVSRWMKNGVPIVLWLVTVGYIGIAN